MLHQGCYAIVQFVMCMRRMPGESSQVCLLRQCFHSAGDFVCHWLCAKLHVASVASASLQTCKNTCKGTAHLTDRGRRVVQSKDREQFGVAYGERFCLLQLVGRAELAKASTRRATPIMSVPNGYNMQVRTLTLLFEAHV